jgi:predicted nucleotidyltransferase
LHFFLKKVGLFLKITGIICEYNPLHLGHKKQMEKIRQLRGADSGIVCLMSGNFVQRGAPAILDKSLRAKAAVLAGADLVLEMPTTVSLSSAEGFAAGGVSILSSFCDALCFGAEDASKAALMEAAKVLLDPGFSEALRAQLDKGLSFPAARQAALTAMGINGELVSQPNNILAVEYCKAILRQNCAMEPLPITRCGSYHDTLPNPENPSATALRQLLQKGESWQSYVPREAVCCFEGAPLHTVESGERAILYRLRSMTDQEFEALPYGSEGLWRKLMHAARKEATLEDILTAVKSKRYTRTRLDRMVMCAFLGITLQDLMEKPPYVRVLAFNDRGREILNLARQTGEFPNAGQQMEHPYQNLENRWEDYYALFSREKPGAAGTEPGRRVFYQPTK